MPLADDGAERPVPAAGGADDAAEGPVADDNAVLDLQTTQSIPVQGGIAGSTRC